MLDTVIMILVIVAFVSAVTLLPVLIIGALE